MQMALNKNEISLSDVKDDILFFSNLEKAWKPIVQNNEGLISTVYLGTESGLMASYDEYSYLSGVPKGENVYYEYKESEWYKTGKKNGGVFLTGLYADSQGRGLTITIGKGFTDERGKFAGVCAADFDITGLYDEIIAMDIGSGAYSFTINQRGEIISPDTAGEKASDVVGLPEDKISYMQKSSEGIITEDDSFYAYAPMEHMGWTLCACVPKSLISEGIQETRNSIRLAMFVFALTAIVLFVLVIVIANQTVRMITRPIEALGRDMERIAKGDLEHRAVPVNNDEIGDTAARLNEMVEHLIWTTQELTDTRTQARQMSEMANKDALTGIRNKNAYDQEIQNLEWALESGDKEFGIAMIDLNYLKRINDTYGHDKGNLAIIKLCYIVCHVFEHSPVFRIGGDEFVVILRGVDYEKTDELVALFRKQMQDLADNKELDTWEKVSAAIGVAFYEEGVDNSVQNVFKRADTRMYEDKKKMKAVRMK